MTETNTKTKEIKLTKTREARCSNQQKPLNLPDLPDLFWTVAPSFGKLTPKKCFAPSRFSLKQRTNNFVKNYQMLY